MREIAAELRARAIGAAPSRTTAPPPLVEAPTGVSVTEAAVRMTPAGSVEPQLVQPEFVQYVRPEPLEPELGVDADEEPEPALPPRSIEDQAAPLPQVEPFLGGWRSHVPTAIGPLTVEVFPLGADPEAVVRLGRQADVRGQLVAKPKGDGWDGDHLAHWQIEATSIYLTAPGVEAIDDSTMAKVVDLVEQTVDAVVGHPEIASAILLHWRTALDRRISKLDDRAAELQAEFYDLCTERSELARHLARAGSVNAGQTRSTKRAST